MQIHELFRKYTEEIALIYLYQSSITRSADKAFEDLIKHEKNVNGDPRIKNKTFRSTHCFTYRDIKYGNFKIFKKGIINIDDEKLAIELLQNKNLMWLLVEAQEHFEIFIKSAYAYAGYIDMNAWFLKDFDKITFAELKEKDFQWYLERAKKVDNFKFEHILNQFARYLPEIKKIEKTNHYDINIKLVLIFIKHLRNTIVHHKGEVSDRDQFIDEVFKKAEVVQKEGKQEIADKEYFENFFGSGKYKNLINILRLRVKENPHEYYNIFEELINYQLAYADLLSSSLAIKASALKSAREIQ